MGNIVFAEFPALQISMRIGWKTKIEGGFSFRAPLLPFTPLFSFSLREFSGILKQIDPREISRSGSNLGDPRVAGITFDFGLA